MSDLPRSYTLKKIRSSLMSKKYHVRFTPAAFSVLLIAGMLANLVNPLLNTSVSAAAQGLSIVGNQLYRDGQPFLPRGFNMIGLLAPAWCTTGQGVAARAHFGQEEMDAAKSWNANTLRFQMSQRGLGDPAISQADKDTYVLRIKEGVALARSNGFNVILSMQDQSNGCGPAHPFPTTQTTDGWNLIAPEFTNDPYIMFELFNEPNHTNSAEGWNQWQNGGTFPNANQGSPAIGQQALIDHMRGLGANNVLIVDGISLAERLEGMPLLSDPNESLMYGIHPYYFTVGQTWWERQYGYLTATKPVIATEWNYEGSKCSLAERQMAPALLNYLRDHNIGLLAHAFDVPGTTITNDWQWTPTDCTTSQGGSGKLTKDYFATQTDPDTNAPTTPTNLQANAINPTRVDLTWDASTDNVAVAKYEVVRDGTAIGETTTPNYNDTTATAETTHSYTVKALDAAGNVSADSDSIAVTTPAAPVEDVTPPTAPTNLQGTSTDSTRVDLTWEASTDDTGVMNYQVQRDGVTVAITTSLTYTDTTVETGTSYTYTVTAVDEANNVSAVSNSVVVTPSDITPPTVPANLQASVSSPTQVNLTWQASTDNVGVATYRIMRNGATLTETSALSYSDTSALAGTAYTYTVKALDAAGNASADSNSVAVTTPTPPDTTKPTTPTNLKARIVSPTKVNLTWNASTDNVGMKSYRIVRGGVTIATIPSSNLTYTDTTMTSGQTHTYAVYAIDQANNVSPASANATAIVPAAAASGLTGAYFDTATLTTQKLTRVDSTVNFAWAAGSPDSKIGVDTFSVRWTGKVIPLANETYTFYTQSDDGVRLWVNNQLIINNWTDHAVKEDAGTITLNANQAYSIKMEYYDKSSHATAKLLWSSPTVTKQVIPASQLLAK